MVVWGLEESTRVGEGRWGEGVVTKVWARDENLLVQQGTNLHIGIIEEDTHIKFLRSVTLLDNDHNEDLMRACEDISVTSEFRDVAYCHRKADHIVLHDIDNARKRKKIFLPEHLVVENCLLSHLAVSKHLIFINSRRTQDITACALFCEKWTGSLVFQFSVTDLIDINHPANLVFCSAGIFFEGRVKGHDYPALTLWKCWDVHGKELFQYEYSSDFGMMLTGSHAGQQSPYR